MRSTLTLRLGLLRYALVVRIPVSVPVFRTVDIIMWYDGPQLVILADASSNYYFAMAIAEEGAPEMAWPMSVVPITEDERMIYQNGDRHFDCRSFFDRADEAWLIDYRVNRDSDIVVKPLATPLTEEMMPGEGAFL